MHPIHHHALPSNHRCDVTYYNHTIKEKVINGRRSFRVRGVAAGDCINFTSVDSSSTVSLKLVKIILTVWLLTSFFSVPSLVPSTYCTTLWYPRRVPTEPVHKQRVDPIRSHQGYVCFTSGWLSCSKELAEHLSKFDYHSASSDPCLFRHKTNGVAFTLVVDDFRVEYKDL